MLLSCVADRGVKPGPGCVDGRDRKKRNVKGEENEYRIFREGKNF